MADASYAIPNFLGGEISKFAQGRFDKPDYRTSLNVCVNSFPAEIGPWIRRPGTQFAGTTRQGRDARVVKFDFEQSAPVTIEFTDGFMRFRSGPNLLTTNDTHIINFISTEYPAVVETASPTNWHTTNVVTFSFLGSSAAELQNRQFSISVIDPQHFSIADAITGDAIGANLGVVISGARVSRIAEIETKYVGDLWRNLRMVQAETTGILLTNTIAPQALTVASFPTNDYNAAFALNPAVFNDGPYLDAFTNGVQATPSDKSGVISLSLSFPAYSASQAYAKGSFVTYSGVNFQSLIDQNQGNTPNVSFSAWAAVSAGAAISPNGFVGTDTGRSIRLLSEPPLWSASSTYAAKAVVSYNPTGAPGAATYWQSITSSNIGNTPGLDLVNWELLPQGASIWTWGRITSLSTEIDRGLAGSVSLGDMLDNGGLNAAFNGVFSQPQAQSTVKNGSGGIIPAMGTVIVTGYVGKNYSNATNQKVSHVVIYPSNDVGLATGSYTALSSPYPFALLVTLNLRASNTLPSSSSDGVLLGSAGPTGNSTAAFTIYSNDQATAFKFIWVEIVVSGRTYLPINASAWFLSISIGQLSFFGPAGTGTSSGVNIEVLGPPLLYTSPVQTWRLGLYSDTTGWPTCGCYYEGRLWLSGAAPNRFDASVSNGISGSTVNFAPTDQYGVVATNNAISYTLNSDSVNPVYWMDPDLQGIILGTQAGEYLVQAPTNGPLAATNITARRVTRIGCANIEPRRTEHTNVFVQRYGQKLMEYFADVYSGKFSAPNLADKAQHITRVGIAELAYQQAITPIIWARGNDGSLFGATYKRDTLTTAQGPTFNGWHRHFLGSGRTVQSICSGPSIDGNLDALTMVTVGDNSIHHVEILTQSMDELSPLSASWFLDDAIVPSSAPSSSDPIEGAPYGGLTINGLWHLNGKTIQVFAGGLDCGDRGAGTSGHTDFVVTKGSCFVPFGDGVSAGSGRGLFTAQFVASLAQFPIVVGFTFTSQGQLVRPIAPPDTGARNGPGFGKIGRAHRYAMLVVNTLGMSVGANLAKKLYPANFKKENGAPLDPLTTFSGIHQDALQDDYGYNSALCWQVERPFPANVIAIGPNLSTQDQ